MAKLDIIDNRVVRLTRDDNNRSLALQGSNEHGRASIRIVLGTDEIVFWRDEFMNAIVALYPDHIAYSFPEDEEDEVEE